MTEEDKMYKHNVKRLWLTAGLVTVAVSFSAAGQAGASGATARTTAREERAAAAVTISQANAMQAAAVAHGEANSVLSNAYIEQKVTTPESVGVNPMRPPAGGF
jgi:hypothetical protein